MGMGGGTGVGVYTPYLDVVADLSVGHLYHLPGDNLSDLRTKVASINTDLESKSIFKDRLYEQRVDEERLLFTIRRVR